MKHQSSSSSLVPYSMHFKPKRKSAKSLHSPDYFSAARFLFLLSLHRLHNSFIVLCSRDGIFKRRKFPRPDIWWEPPQGQIMALGAIKIAAGRAALLPPCHFMPVPCALWNTPQTFFSQQDSLQLGEIHERTISHGRCHKCMEAASPGLKIWRRSPSHNPATFRGLCDDSNSRAPLVASPRLWKTLVREARVSPFPAYPSCSRQKPFHPGKPLEMKYFKL